MNELVGFIVDARKAGETNDEIIVSLVEKGWSNEQILEAMIEADKIIPPVVAATSTNPVETTVPATFVDQPAPTADISAFAVPSEEIVESTPILSQQLPDIELPSSNENVQRYVNDSALTVPKKSFSKGVIVSILVILFLLAGSGYAYTKKIITMPFGLLQNTKTASTAFADYEVIKKDSAIMLNDSVRFTITGFQTMSSGDFNALQAESTSTISSEKQALLIYYTLQNTSDNVQVLSTLESNARSFSIVDSKKSRVDVNSNVFLESLSTLTEIKARQYTSNAIIFEIPKSYTNLHDLYFILESQEAQPKKGYIKL